MSNGKILYDFSASLAALGATSVDSLAAGDHIHDEFVYIDPQWAMETAWRAAARQRSSSICGASTTRPASAATATGNTVEDASTTAGGVLTVTDVDHGQNVFQAVAAAALVGAYGDFTFDRTSGAWGYTLDHTRADSLGYGEVVHDTLTVLSADGTASKVIDVTVNGAIDAPVVTASAAQPSIKQGDAVALNIAATDVDHAASLSYAITGVPDGAALTSQADPGGVNYDAASQTWLVSAGALADLTLTPDAEFSGEIDLTVTVDQHRGQSQQRERHRDGRRFGFDRGNGQPLHAELYLDHARRSRCLYHDRSGAQRLGSGRRLLFGQHRHPRVSL